MNPQISVVVPVYNGEATLGECLRSLCAQSVPRSAYELIVVDDGSSDASARIAADFGARLVRQGNSGTAAARNAGVAVASGEWIAFTDADCVASRGWLAALMRTATTGGDDVLCVAGKTYGLASNTPAARFADVTGALDAGRHLAHPRYPFAPSGNVLYRRSVLVAVGGYDRRFRSYEACDLHQRLRGLGRCVFEPRAVVFHRHRATWRDYARQQRSYGAGLAAFVRSRSGEIDWSLGHEFDAWSRLLLTGAKAALPGSPEATLVRRGTWVKSFAQRVGFAKYYWVTGALEKVRFLLRCPGILARAVRTPGDVVLLLRIAAFVARLPGLVRADNFQLVLHSIRNAPRAKSPGFEIACERVARLRDACLMMPWLRRGNTCYIKALTLYRFVDTGGKHVRIHFGVEQPTSRVERLRGHAWISVDGRPFEAPDAVLEGRTREVQLPYAT